LGSYSPVDGNGFFDSPPFNRDFQILFKELNKKKKKAESLDPTVAGNDGVFAIKF